MIEAPELGTTRPAYGSYILRTGEGLVADLELIYGAHWYQTRFAGKRPILDLGSGRCWFTKQNLRDIIAVDNAPEVVEHYRQQGINIHFGDAYAIPFPDAYFEAVFCCWLLEHLTEPDRAMRQIYRVLKPGGYALIIAPSPHEMVAFYDDYTHIRPYTPVSLTQLAEDVGFRRHQVECHPWDRGIRRVLGILGSGAAAAYIRFSDRMLRNFGLVNKKNLLLNAWK